MNDLNKNYENENKNESTIINEDDFEIYESKSEKDINENNKEENKPKTLSRSENFDKILIKDAEDEEQIRFDFIKEYKKRVLNQDNNFLKRMDNDIDKRKNMEKIMNKFIEQTKYKIKEEENIKVFNRLIKDTNRRYESKEKLLNYQEEQEQGFEFENNKKYNQKQWDEVYKNRFEIFLKHLNLKKIKGISDILQKELDKIKKKEPKQINKKKTLNKREIKRIIENNTNNLYYDYLLRKQRKINRENNNNMLIAQKYELIKSNKLNKAKKYIQSPNKLKNKEINLKTNKYYEKKIEDNNRKINNFTPKAMKTKNFYIFSNIEEDMKKINNNLDGEKISELLINIFLKKNGI